MQGPNNHDLLNDPLYLGWRHPRIRGHEYELFVDRFVQAIKKRYPRILLQWEDFSKDQAQLLLDRYRHQICSFNDDIQGTASVVLAALLAAVKINDSSLQEQRIIIFGGGSAGMGIGHHLVGYMISMGISEKKAKESIYVVDIQGLIYENLSKIQPRQKFFSRQKSEIESWKVKNPNHITLYEVVKEARPTVLIGVSAQRGEFSEKIIKTMAEHVKRPIIFPLSNPTLKSEADPAEILAWTKGSAIVATGSPFGEVCYEKKKIFVAQCNNIYIYPGIGLAAIACKARAISDSMFYEAARTLSLHSPIRYDFNGALLPSLEKLTEISREIALNVINVAENEGLATKTTTKEKEEAIDRVRWFPKYTEMS